MYPQYNFKESRERKLSQQLEEALNPALNSKQSSRRKYSQQPEDVIQPGRESNESSRRIHSEQLEETIQPIDSKSTGIDNSTGTRSSISSNGPTVHSVGEIQSDWKETESASDGLGNGGPFHRTGQQYLVKWTNRTNNTENPVRLDRN